MQEIAEFFGPELSKSGTQYFIFDTTPAKSHRDLDFEVYSWSRKKYNRVHPGDLFVYRRPKGASEIRGEFYFFGAGKVERIKDKEDGEVEGIVAKPIPFPDVVTQSQMEKFSWDFRYAQNNWEHSFSQYGMKLITKDDFLGILNLAFQSGQIDPEDLKTENDLVHQISTGNYAVDDNYTTQKIRGSSQQVFSRAVKINYWYRCAITGICNSRYLIGSHIIPWSKDKDKRLDPRNGICLSTLLDKAFDIGDITITPDFKVKISAKLEDSILLGMIKPFAGKKIKLPVRDHPDLNFLKWHNDNVFKG